MSPVQLTGCTQHVACADGQRSSRNSAAVLTRCRECLLWFRPDQITLAKRPEG